MGVIAGKRRDSPRLRMKFACIIPETPLDSCMKRAHFFARFLTSRCVGFTRSDEVRKSPDCVVHKCQDLQVLKTALSFTIAPASKGPN